jgi:Zn-dependent protease
MAPEYGSSVNVQFVTRLTGDRSLVTGDLAISIHLSVPTVSEETIGGASLPELMARHLDRIRAVSSHEMQTDPIALEPIAAAMTATYATVRKDFRARGWCVQSNDASLDRVTLRGAFGLVDRSKKAFGPKGASLAPVGEATDANRQLRAEVDFQCVRRVARSPRTAPGVPWPLLIIMGAAALISVVGMATLWNIRVASIIFLVILVHEAGHALTMRVVGHSAVHIFFVPFLGALTIGRSMNASVRERLAILLAGPVPGLLIGLALLTLYGHARDPLWKSAAIGFLLINALNLIPVIPLDGGRFFEALTRPEGITRFVLQLASSGGLLAVAFILKDPVFSGLAVLSLLLLPKQWLAFRFRRTLGRQLMDRGNWLGVVKTALVVMTEPQFASWRSPARQVLARAAADQFITPVATKMDWFVGMLGYIAGIAILMAASVVWVRLKSI